MRRAVSRACLAVKPDSSPGFPLKLCASNNRKALERYGDAILDATVHRLLLLFDDDGVEKSPLEAVRLGYRDPVLPFIKTELHPPRKVSRGAWRIVQGCSLVDQLVERVLFSTPVTVLKSHYPYSDAVVGIGFSDSMNEEFYEEVMTSIPDPISTDVSGWDRSLGRSYVVEASESVIRSCSHLHPHWVRAVRAHALLMTSPLFALPHGQAYSLVTRNAPGGMLSGSYLTTTYNTLARLDASLLAGSERAKAAGDDCLEVFPTGVDPVLRYREIGFNVRTDLHPPGVFEFCSHRYSGTDPKQAPLTSWRKAVANYFSLKKPTLDHLRGLLHELRHNDDLGWILELAKSRCEGAGPADVAQSN